MALLVLNFNLLSILSGGALGNPASKEKLCSGEQCPADVGNPPFDVAVPCSTRKSNSRSENQVRTVPFCRVFDSSLFRIRIHKN